MVCGGWEGHEPEKRARLFAPLLEENDYGVEISTTLDSYLDSYLDAEWMRALDLIVPIRTMGSITEEQERGLIGAVEGLAGLAGLAGWHGGMADSFRESITYQFMVGRRWAAGGPPVGRPPRQHHRPLGRRRGPQGPVTAGL